MNIYTTFTFSFFFYFGGLLLSPWVRTVNKGQPAAQRGSAPGQPNPSIPQLKPPEVNMDQRRVQLQLEKVVG